MEKMYRLYVEQNRWVNALGRRFTPKYFNEKRYSSVNRALLGYSREKFLKRFWTTEKFSVEGNNNSYYYNSLEDALKRVKTYSQDSYYMVVK